jgi:lysophospholipase L1-like esterase
LYDAFLTEASDQTGTTGELATLGSSSDGSGSGHAPVLLAGKFRPLVRKPIVSIWGDSITEGVGDTPDATEGFATKACRLAAIPSVKLGKGSERGASQTIGSRIARRLAISDGATHAIYEHGTNDYRSPVMRSTPPYLAANTIINCQRLKSRGMKVYATTLVPATSSSDAWATVVGQTVHVNDGWRTRYNDWLRDGAPVAQTTLSAATTINGATITGLVSTTGFETAGLAIIDGQIIHYTGKTATTLTGCEDAIDPYAARTGVTIAADTLVFGIPGWVSTTAGASQTLPLATINLLSGHTTDGFGSTGTIEVGCVAGTGNQTVTYTGKTSGSFTGCSGGSGAIGSSGILQDLTVSATVIVAASANHPLEGYFDTADEVESARNSGKWAASHTGDGVHPNTTGHAAMATAIDTDLFVVED